MGENPRALRKGLGTQRDSFVPPPIPVGAGRPDCREELTPAWPPFACFEAAPIVREARAVLIEFFPCVGPRRSPPSASARRCICGPTDELPDSVRQSSTISGPTAATARTSSFSPQFRNAPNTWLITGALPAFNNPLAGRRDRHLDGSGGRLEVVSPRRTSSPNSA